MTSYDDSSDRNGFTYPKRVLRANYSLGAEITTVTKSYSEEYPSSPVRSPLFLSVTRPFEQCEAMNGWACERCSCHRNCLRLFDQIVEADMKQKLDSMLARQFIEQFEKIRVRMG